MTWRTRNRDIAAVLAGCALLAALTMPAAAQDNDTPSLDDTPHVTLVGTAHAEVSPDIADVSIGVTKEDRDPAKASEADSAVARRLVDIAKAEGVAAADIRTQAVELTEVFDSVRQPDDSFRQVSRGFKASFMLGIRIRALDHAGLLAQKLIAGGANRFDGIGLSVEHPEATTNKLLGAAVEDAKRQAAIVSHAAGIKLGRIMLVTRLGERTTASPTFLPRPEMVSKSMPIEPGTQGFDADIQVTWAIAP